MSDAKKDDSINTWGPRGPIAEKRPHIVLAGKVEGENRGENPMDPPLEIKDDLFWLRDDDRKDPDVLRHLRTEAAYLEGRTAHLKPLAAAINEEHINNLKETDTTAPKKHGKDWFYYSRTIKGLSYTIYCRKPSASATQPASEVSLAGELGQDADEQVVLDVNKIAEGHAQCAVVSVTPSPDHKYFAYAVDFTGNEVYELRIVDAATGEVKETLTGPNDGGLEWGKGPNGEGAFLFYTTRDEALRSFRAHCHRVGTPQSEDTLLFEEPDELYNVGVSASLQGDHIIVDTSSDETSECFLIDLAAVCKKDQAAPIATKDDLQVVRKREDGVRYHIAGIGHGCAYVCTNKDKAMNNKVIAAPLTSLGDWSKELIEHDETRKIDSIEVFSDFAVVTGRQHGLTQVWTMRCDADKKALDIATWARVPTDEEAYDIDTGANLNFETSTVRIVYSSMITPDTHFDFDPVTGAKAVVKTKEVHGYDRTKYVCERRTATAPDGVKVKMSVVRRKTAADEGKNDEKPTPKPTLLYGYGSYGICIDPSWSSAILPYLDRGVTYVIAHVRGGGEEGRAWYEVGGKYLTKRNTFSDFIACAESLIEDGLTKPEMLACEGRSAGGLLVGAVLNQRPDLFCAALSAVNFSDVMVTMVDPSIPLTTGEWLVWGNPNTHRYFDYMRSYCPMSNIFPQKYPNVLSVAGLHDPRVAYWEPAKWVSRVREANTNKDSEILLKMDMEVGHFSASDRYKHLREKAFEQAFVLSHIHPDAVADKLGEKNPVKKE